jgi:putative transposase
VKRTKTPSFVAEFPVRTYKPDEEKLSIRFEAARQIFNACLGEALRRLDLMRESRRWQEARKMPKGEERTEIFKETVKRFEFNSASIQKFAEQCRDACWIGKHLGSHDTQTMSLRAFRAVEQHAYGKRGRPRFKGKNRVNSIEGKGDAVLILRMQDKRPVIKWDGLVLPLILDLRDKDDWEKNSLAHRTKYVRILRRKVRGRILWYVQLVQEGIPPRKANRPLGKGNVAADLGPSTIAAVSETDAILETFCPSVKNLDREIRRIQRAMDRSRRATNPDCYNSDGTWKKGSKIKVRSRHYLRLAAKKADLERCMASERKREHGELSNRMLAQGDVFKIEKLSYKSFQKNWGRSVRRRAPSMFVSMFRRKAESAGGRMIEFGTRKTRLSQYDHKSREYIKKPLSQRWHEFKDGTKVQRDLYSAWLARFVEKEDQLDVSQLDESWAAAEPLLRRAASSFKESVSGRGFPLPHAKSVRMDRPSKRERRRYEAVDVVAKARTTERIDNGDLRISAL